MAKGLQPIPESQLLKEVGRSSDGELVFIVTRSRNPQVELSLKVLPHRYEVEIQMEDGRVLDEGYILPR